MRKDRTETVQSDLSHQSALLICVKDKRKLDTVPALIYDMERALTHHYAHLWSDVC